ncbi:DNA polymerase III subunit delta' [Sporosalibacterium faouarense]|uniref:DNA polymerase III subunit delta' n=1 Tax=Sporosalibacterium faouarense TaxID=516123 RepID=UPI00141C777B|nr:DNA polymerase III subunit delta' [Sporosalibacterium faouarense]MTI48812.1 DNA polymerase III subunit delta' [Bacillota bacterium]
MDYSHVVGHENIIKRLQNSIKKGNVSHSYLFEGPKAIGKSKVAEVFAKTLLCKEKGVQPCNQCSSCLKFDSGNHPDVFIGSAEGESFKKGQVEDLQRSIKTLPYEGDKKIYILEDIDKMTQQAQNSFLKTLEEPPSYVTIIMTVINSYSLLPTIISRCQVLKFKPVESMKIESLLLNNLGKTQEEAQIITSFSNGIIGRAIILAESEDFKAIREEVISVIDTTLKSNKYKIFSISEFFQNHKEMIEDILDMMMVWFRDILFIKELDNNQLIINKDKIETLSQHSLKIGREKIHEIIQALNNAKENIVSNVNYELAIEVMLLRIQEV